MKRTGLTLPAGWRRIMAGLYVRREHADRPCLRVVKPGRARVWLLQVWVPRIGWQHVSSHGTAQTAMEAGDARGDS